VKNTATIRLQEGLAVSDEKTLREAATRFNGAGAFIEGDVTPFARA
jgi:hypothetical protein